MHTGQPIPVMGLLLPVLGTRGSLSTITSGSIVEVCKPWDLGPIPVIHVLNCQSKWSRWDSHPNL